MPRIWPVSSLGRKPLDDAERGRRAAGRDADERRRASRRWRSTHARASARRRAASRSKAALDDRRRSARAALRRASAAGSGCRASASASARRSPRPGSRRAIVTANSWKQPADDAAHEQHGDEHGDERDRHREDREADLAASRRAPPAAAGFPHLHVAHDVLEHHDRVVDDEADRSVSAISERLSRLKPSRYITANVPTIDDRQREARDERRRQVPQEQEDHQHDEARA